MARSKLRLRPWKPGDQDAFTPRADFAAERATVAWDWSAGAPGPTFTLCRWDGRIEGVAGFVPQADGSWQAWAWLAPLPKRDWPQLLWLAERTMGTLEATGKARNFLTLAGSMGAVRCLRRLGFHRFGRRVVTAGRSYNAMRREIA